MKPTVLMLWCAAALGCSARAGLYEAKGYWIHDPHYLRGKSYSHRFSDVRATPSLGVIVRGDKYVLRIYDGEPRVILGWNHYLHEFPPNDAVAELDPDTLMFAGDMSDLYVEKHGVEAQFAISNVLVTLLDRDGRERLVAGPPRPDGREWHVSSLHEAGDGLVYAILSVTILEYPKPLSLRPDAPDVAASVFRFDGASWARLPDPPGGPYLAFHSACTTSDGTLWIAGEVLQVDSERALVNTRGYVAKLENGVWREDSPPPPKQHHVTWATSEMLCGATGLWLAGGAIAKPERVRSWLGPDFPIAYRFEEGEWTQLELPPPAASSDGRAPEAFGIGGFTLDRDERLWISYWRHQARIVEPIYRFDGAWSRYSLPPIAGIAWYQAHSIAFDERGEGWAVSNVWDGDAWSHGILLRFRDGEWRLQNWTWPFWRHRWLGLFG